MQNLPTRNRQRSRRVLWLLLAALSLSLFAGAGLVAKRSHRPPHKAAFSIRGDLNVRLHPGNSQPINLVLTNPRRFALGITRLKVRLRVDRRHARAGCSARRDFRAVQLRRRAYPIRLGARQRRSLTRLRVRKSELPRIKMINRHGRNQDACKGAKLTLTYSGAARR
jgi:hypothetical protein